jgi:glutathione synthase/RimK-type ligase-like ATP-grasp enzyme
MHEITILTDYKGHFGTRYDAYPYRSGTDKDLIKKYFMENNFTSSFLHFSKVNLDSQNWENKTVLYTSQEDKGQHYKNYIEDVVFSLEQSGAFVIPSFKYLRAHNNKVYMEFLRRVLKIDNNELKSYHFGTIEELKKFKNNISFPVVIKGSAGAMSRNVMLARNEKELLKNAKKLSKSNYLLHDLKEIGRAIKYRGYIKESKNREKFIVQEFVPGLKNDWKVVIFGKRFYVLYRGVKENDFRASGSKVFRFNEDHLIPDGLLDYASSFFNKLGVPAASLDIIKRSNNFYVVEFQSIYFGTSTHLKSNGYFKKSGNKWQKRNEKLDLEKVYVDSVADFIHKNIL